MRRQNGPLSKGWGGGDSCMHVDDFGSASRADVKRRIEPENH